MLEPVAHLLRIHHNRECTLGLFYLEEASLLAEPPRLNKIYACMEPPWADNKPNISCIPAGKYRLVKYYSTRFKQTLFKAVDAEKSNLLMGRDGIALHWGNKAHETQGCFLIGRGMLLAPPLVQYSKEAFKEVMTILKNVQELPFRITYV